jgi:DNA-binding NtrC family response regulator
MPSRVLIVEDDDVLRWLMTEALMHLGYEATGCIALTQLCLS